MRVELGLFNGDDLLSRDEIKVEPVPRMEMLTLFQADHRLHESDAEIVFSAFADHIGLTRVDLNMPIHESDDWESIQLGRYTLAFWCHLDAL